MAIKLQRPPKFRNIHNGFWVSKCWPHQATTDCVSHTKCIPVIHEKNCDHLHYLFFTLLLIGLSDDKCSLRQDSLSNASFTPGVCGYMCPTRTRIKEDAPRFYEYKVVWPNRGGGFGMTEIVDVVNLQSENARSGEVNFENDEKLLIPIFLLLGGIMSPKSWTLLYSFQ